MLQPKKPLDLSEANQILQSERKPLDLSSAEAILKKKESTELPSTAPVENTESVQKVGSLDGVGSNGFPAIDVNLGVPGLKPELKTVEQLANPPKSKQSEVKTPEKRGFASEVFHKLATGSSQLGVDIAAIPELLYDTFSVPQNAIADYFDLPNLRTDSEKFKKTIGVKNAVKELYQDEVKKLREQSALVDEKYKYGIYDSFKNGDVEGGLRQLTNSFAESLPATTAIMLGGAYTKAPQLLATSTMMFGAGKNEQLKEENPEMSANARVANALGTGFAEGAFETMGSGSIGAAAKGLVEKEGVKKGAQILKDGLVDFYKSALAKSPFTASIVGEGVEEWATQVTQNAIDVATGAKPQDFNIFDGATDAFIGGSFGGSVFGAGLKGLEKIANNEDKVAIKSNLKKTFELQKALENPNISEESKAEIHKTIDGLVKTNQELVKKNVDFADNLDPKLKEKLATADSKIDEIKNKIKAIKLDGNTTDTQKQILLDNLKQDFEKNASLKSDILDGKTTVVDVLPLKEQDKLKRQALKELTAEQNPDGTKNIEIDNAQIVERANKIYLKENEKPQEVAVTETKLQTEVPKQSENKKVIIPDEIKDSHSRGLQEHQESIADLEKKLAEEKALPWLKRDRQKQKWIEEDIKFHKESAKMLEENPIQYYKDWIESDKEQHNRQLKEKFKDDNGKTYKELFIEKYGSDKYEDVYSGWIESVNDKISKLEEANKPQAEIETESIEIKNKKADIEKRKQEDLSKLETLELGDTFAPKGTVSEKLLEIGKFFQNFFGWKFEGKREYPLYVSKENNRVEFDINGLEVNLEEGQTFRLMGGAAYPTFTPQELIEAKYKAELDAFKGVKKTDIQKRRQEEYNTQYNALVAGQVLDNQGDPIYEEDKGIKANGLSTLTDKKYGHGHIRTSGLNSLKVLESLLGGSDFSGMFGQIGIGDYSTWENGKFIIVSDKINPITDNKLNLNEIEVVLNAGLSTFAQELANKYPNVIFKDFNGKKYDAELKESENASNAQIESISDRFEKSLTLLKDIETKQGVDARNAKRERAEFLKQNPTIKYIDDNYKNITKQLEEQGLFKQLKDC